MQRRLRQPQRAASAAMKGIKDREEYARHACETWLDVRTFGQVFAFKDAKGFSCGVRGPVSIHQASSLSPRGDRVPPDHQEREW